MGWSTKKSLVLSRRILGREIIADIVRLDEGIQLSVYGGEWTHVGAVTVISASGNISTIQFPGHKEAVISETWAEKFYQMFQVPVVCSAGIHYDNLEANEILKITELVEDMLAEGVDTVLSGKCPSLRKREKTCMLLDTGKFPCGLLFTIESGKNELYLSAKYGNMKAIEERQRRLRHEEQNIILQ